MNIHLVPGKYVVAVSGGVDSVVLLHLLATQSSSRLGESPLSLTVAHFDHGIRPESASDKQFVQALAESYGLPFTFERVELGSTASEAVARNARYTFLTYAQQAAGANAVVTAHHKDDLLETAMLNLLRGTGRKGVTSLASRNGLQRPLLEFSKHEIVAYAKQHNLEWREDSTNADQRYRRNYVRHTLIPRLDTTNRERFHRLIADQRQRNEVIDVLVQHELQSQPTPGTLERRYFNQLPHQVAREVLVSWLRQEGITAFDTRTIERLVVAAKTAYPGKHLALMGNCFIIVTKHDLALEGLER